MIVERTFEGWEARIRARGFARYFTAVFMGFWLCGWAVGEVFALGILVGIAWQCLTGEPIHPGLPSIEQGAAPLPVAAGLLLWLTFWTFGGWAAGHTFLRLLWGEDRIVARPDGLRLIRSAGPFHRTREFSRDQVRRFYRAPGRGLQRHLMVDTAQGAQLVTEFATLEELDQLETELARELGLKPSTTVALPSGWEETAVPEGGAALIESPAKRQRHAFIVSTITAMLSLAALGFAGARTIVAALVVGVLAVLFGWGAMRLLFGRHEWRWGAGRLRLDWRFRGKARTVFEGTSLELGISSDSDNDDWYELDVFATPPPETGPATKGRKRKSIVRTLRDPQVPRALGEWLAQRSGLPLNDRTNSVARSAQTEQLRQQLAASGKLGSWISKMIPPAGGRR